MKRAVGMLGMDFFQRDASAELRIIDFPDDSLAPLANRFAKHIAVDRGV